MTMQSPVPSRNLIPDTAPFSEEQRDWLSGFFFAALAPLAPPSRIADAALFGDGPRRQ